MKKNNWYKALSLADDKYVEEARPDNTIKLKRRFILPIVAACACLALTFCSLWLFIPFSTSPPDVSKYSDSEYYGLIQKLNALTFNTPTYKNNADRLLSGLKRFDLDLGVKKENSDNMAPELSTEDTNGTSNYQEITDNQVGGIIEADLIKRSDTHIYYLDDGVLKIYAIDKENTKEVGSYTLFADNNNRYLDQWEFYLSNDCKTVTIISECYIESDDYYNSYVNLISLNVSDPKKHCKKRRIQYYRRLYVLTKDRWKHSAFNRVCY